MPTQTILSAATCACRTAALSFVLLACLQSGCDRKNSSTPTPRKPPPPPISHPAAVAGLKPLPQIQHVILISVDGLRPDLISRSGAFHLNDLIHHGAFSLWAQSPEMPMTLPSHASMLTGVKPSRHTVEFNTEQLDTPPVYPTLFDQTRANGLTSSFVAGKSKMASLVRPGAIDWPMIEEADCLTVANRAVKTLMDHRPNLLVVHFNECDYAGHYSGWGSPHQLAELRRVDEAIGKLLAAVSTTGLKDSTIVIVTADHGGATTGHGALEPRSTTIPWIARGPGLYEGFDLDRARETPIRTEDTFATVSTLLGLPLAPDIDGRFVSQMIKPTDKELMFETK